MNKLEKIKICEGVYWLEVREVNLRVLCGCPADIVKHLMKKGLIVSKKVDGVECETGPNAILLSDVLIQHGAFSNLSEFPILQMLYRQGMMLPDHPNNNGTKPLIMGREKQIKAQMEYLHRGNYGLISEEEMLQAGAQSWETADLMRMKLAFAFGRIRSTDELVDSLAIDGDRVEIRNGVFISRISLNRFRFDYQGESMTVNLNLPYGREYQSPYPLGYHRTSREYFSVIHSGDGDGWDQNRPSMASIISYQGKIYLIDAGPNIMHSLTSLGIGITEIEGVFHTHAHDDHFAGLPALMRSDHKIKYFATSLVRASVMKKLSGLLSLNEEEFSHYFEVHDLVPEVWNNIDSLEVRPMISPHPVETNILFFQGKSEKGHKIYAHLADIVSMDVLKSMLEEDESKPGVSHELHDQIASTYLSRANLKKIDAGGGLIHGNAEDFRFDASDTMFLAHTSGELTDRQKEIGSGAPFGMVDVLIPGHQDYHRMYAHSYLRAYFPGVPEHQIRMLMNNPLITFNPQSILLKRMTIPEYIYLIITGDVEMIDTESGLKNVISAGGLVGEIASLLMAPTLETYRAANFVQALRLPRSMYFEFIKDNGLYGAIENLQDTREFLQKTKLFGEAITNPLLSRIAKHLEVTKYKKSEEIAVQDLDGLALIRKGRAAMTLGRSMSIIIEPGGFFGEEHLLSRTIRERTVHFQEETHIFHIHKDNLLDIPIVRWKLYETFEQRRETQDYANM